MRAFVPQQSIIPVPIWDKLMVKHAPRRKIDRAHVGRVEAVEGGHEGLSGDATVVEDAQLVELPIKLNDRRKEDGSEAEDPDACEQHQQRTTHEATCRRWG